MIELISYLHMGGSSHGVRLSPGGRRGGTNQRKAPGPTDGGIFGNGSGFLTANKVST